ncbi:MAG TPA: Ig-like domain-containing protein, partial [Nannocystaceae bacterium]|nr:Ig-like domain-containing protein [Nannocystaceae bacterium]
MTLHVPPWCLAVIAPAVLVVPASASADPGDDPPVSRAVPIPVPDAAPRATSSGAPKAAKQGVIYVNFDGVSLSEGYDSSQSNVSQIFGGQFAPYGGDGTERAAVMEAVRHDWEPYNVLVVDSRPASGDYTMNVTSPSNPIGQGVLGIAPLDCDDQQTHNNITFAFHGAGDQFPAAVQATTIGQEVAHSYGLEHVDDPNDVMNPYNAGGDASFTDVCLPIVQGGNCGQQHAAHCGSGQSQNSHQELLTLFGPSAPDTQAPTVSITSPADGDVFAVGTDFTIEATAADDAALAELELFDGPQALQTDASEPYSWQTTGIPEGVYQFKVVARDLAGNEAESNIVEIIVGDPPAPSEGSGDSGDDEDDDDGDSGDDEDDDDDDGGTGDTLGMGPGGDDDKGCGCASGRPIAFGAWWAVLVLAV